MSVFRRALGAFVVVAALVAALALPGGASAAEEQAGAPALPFDPLALEFLLPSDRVDGSWNVSPLPKAAKPVGSITYSWAGKTKTVDQFLGEAGSDAFLVLKDGKIAYERYWDINSAFSPHQSWSMMKSVVSAMIGIAIGDGKIDSVDDPVDKYVPALAGNGYKGVRIRDVLHMASGVKWNETYLDFINGDVNYLIAEPVLNNLTFGLAGNSLSSYVSQSRFTRAVAPGTAFAYSSMDSEVLGMVLRGATGKTPARYLEEKIWKPAGMSGPTRLLKDRQGTNFTFCCLYATARDYGRFGELFRNGGKRGSKQIVPQSWVADSTTASEPWLQIPQLGYGYQWWLDRAAPGNFFANGFEGQNIYVSPADGVTIVKLADDLTLSGPDRMAEVLLVLRTIAQQV